MTIPQDKLLSLYRTMVRIRRCENQLARSYAAGTITGACHTYVGEEAVATGVCAHLRDDDAVFSTHRGHGHALAKGVPPRELVAELFGRVTGCSGGRGGSMHLFSPEVGMMGTSGIVGPCILQAAGAGYSFQLRETDQVGVAFFGDGAVGNGAFHEGINLATIWDLPVLFVCENNMYATEVAFANSARNTDVAGRAAGYGLHADAVDGNDVVAVYEAAGAAVARAREGGGPSLIECRTYRTRPHAEGMRDGGYRTQEEIDSWKARDPITSFARALLDDGIAIPDELQVIDDEIAVEVQQAVDFATQSPWPDAETVADHVYGTDA
ncbi:MAG TPA: thiamine pyrophosphate-dependent dehydrogenase E1 component subunit alpha [Candidatus Latescibacteria bacterium]|jgi:2-oxoisovalerate dehydrogenase E1 component|nr:thiamine pyrophosphate-dependent dehydrogenase E1 component subunit alpha [Candidatus Latescibacterota bacterium]HJP32463.1 thiamine pyrophosphate-dependent dehydrogenase E1 component subunit alpha [Candidatus Latescibacterota bacterium]